MTDALVAFVLGFMLTAATIALWCLWAELRTIRLLLRALTRRESPSDGDG